MTDLNKLKDGFKNFRRYYFEDNPDLYRQLTEKGQSPCALVVSCCDSRVHPAQVMGADPGDIFVVRNVANLVPPYVDDGKTHGTSAAIEFAVKHLHVPHIIIMGHSQCGGIRALMEGKHKGKSHKFIDPWMAIMAAARERVCNQYAEAGLDEQCSLCERLSISISINNLLTFPFVLHAVEDGILQLHGWYFDFENGVLSELHNEDNRFVPIE